ncbi:MAG: antitoxin VapB family protein [Deltaproteobacteria bacterium]|nr:antitoxin VapB family protein [Deltaproteobacteria bacterium]
MGRLTITLDDDVHRALKETAARQRRSIGRIIEESLELRGIRSEESARRLVACAHAQCSEEEAVRQGFLLRGSGLRVAPAGSVSCYIHAAGG